MGDFAWRGEAGASRLREHPTEPGLEQQPRDLPAKYHVTLDRTAPPGITMKDDGCCADSPLAEPRLANPAVDEAAWTSDSVCDGRMRNRLSPDQEPPTNRGDAAAGPAQRDHATGRCDRRRAAGLRLGRQRQRRATFDRAEPDFRAQRFWRASRTAAAGRGGAPGRRLGRTQ